MKKKQEPPNEAKKISKRTKQLGMNLKRHLTMNCLGALNTTYLVFIECQQQKRKNIGSY